MEYNEIVNNLFKNIEYKENNIIDIKAPWNNKTINNNTNSDTSDTDDTSSSDSENLEDNSLDIDMKYDKMITQRNSIYSIEPQINNIYQNNNYDEIDNITSNEEDTDSEDSNNLFSDNDIEDYSKNIKIKKIDEISLDENPLEHLHTEENLSIDLFNKEVEEFDYYIVIENGYKNSSGVYTIFDPNDTVQTVLLDRTFNNVIKADLIECVIKNNVGNSYVTDPSGTPFILLEVDEFGSNYESNNSNIANCFKKLSYYNEINSGTTHKNYTELENNIEKYFNPRKTIGSITLRFKKQDGTNFVFSSSSITTATYWLTFKITCLERRLKTNYINKPTA